MDVASFTPRRSPHTPRIYNAGNALPQQFASPVTRIGCPPDAQIRDAEMSVEFLCQKFEALSEQLQREEVARAEVERRGAYLASEVRIAEADAAKRSESLASELSGNDACLIALRTSVTATSSRASLEAEKAREEKTSEAHFEKQCATFQEKCKSESSQCEVMLARLTSQNSEALQERGDLEKVGRRLRQVQADTRVSLEDLRIAQMRALLVQGELQTLEANVENMNRMREDMQRSADACTQRLQEKCRQLDEREAHLQSLIASREATCSEAAMQERRMVLLQDETRVGQQRLSALQQELQATQHELQTCSSCLHAEVEASNALTQELMTVERRRLHDVQEIADHRRSLSEVESTLDAARKGASERRVGKEAAVSFLEQLLAEEEGHTAVVSEMRRARHADDMAFEDIQSELQVAFRRRESLGEELALRLRAREQLLTKLRCLRPEVAEAEERCRHVEEQLAHRARDLEAEIAQQRRYRQEMSVVSDSLYEAQRHEAYLEAQLHHSLIFPLGARSPNMRPASVSPARSTFSSRNLESSQPRAIGEPPLSGVGNTPRGSAGMWPITPRASDNRQAPARRPSLQPAKSQSPQRSVRHRGAAPAPWASPAPRLRPSSQPRYRHS
mmetsp:Transcript_63273/g.98389  ORF Transcript_63273/g.98389 Transcript_63273/m.98389 type:complete len:621 (-) Transcript_63273:221-2083(-)